VSYALHRYTEVEAPIAEVFEFFSNASNLAVLTPPELQFRIITPQPIEMKPGALIDYRIGLWGVPMKWRTRIGLWEPPHLFVDEQLSGPYRTWVHTHRFTALPNGGTGIDDRVDYTMRFGPIGRVAAPLVRRELERIFDYRTDRIRTLFSSLLLTGPAIGQVRPNGARFSP
jgi:ligand-binding SRPBCC domain-containing protein